jgi:hypothetical protein
MNVFRASRTGWVFLVAYLVLAGYLFHEALTCSDWVCDLVALPAAFPLGILIAWLYDGIDYLFVLPHLTGGLLHRWHFILPTVLANAVFYFWAGRQIEKLLRRLFSPSAKPS